MAWRNLWRESGDAAAVVEAFSAGTHCPPVGGRCADAGRVLRVLDKTYTGLMRWADSVVLLADKIAANPDTASRWASSPLPRDVQGQCQRLGFPSDLRLPVIVADLKLLLGIARDRHARLASCSIVVVHRGPGALLQAPIFMPFVVPGLPKGAFLYPVYASDKTCQRLGLLPRGPAWALDRMYPRNGVEGKKLLLDHTAEDAMQPGMPFAIYHGNGYTPYIVTLRWDEHVQSQRLELSQSRPGPLVHHQSLRYLVQRCYQIVEIKWCNEATIERILEDRGPGRTHIDLRQHAAYSIRPFDATRLCSVKADALRNVLSPGTQLALSSRPGHDPAPLCTPLRQLLEVEASGASVLV